MNRVRISHPAGFDLEGISAYVEREANEDQAAKLIDRILRAAELLAYSPRIGRRCDDLLPNARVLPLGAYLIYYREMESGVVI